MTRRKPAPGSPHRLFFPAALVLGAIIVPLKAAESAGWISLPPLPVFWHGHEMVFGVAYGVIGGYLLVGRSRQAVGAAFVAWLAGRAGLPLQAEAPMLSAGLALAYPLALALLVGLRFARAAKTGRNAVFAPIVFGFLIVQAVHEIGAIGLFANGGERLGLLLASDLVFILIFAMGGRIIAGATSGAHQAQGRKLTGVAQPRLEQVGLVALAGMLLLEAWDAARPVTGGLAIAAGAIVLLRLAQWRALRVIRIPEVSLLHLGYLWLAAGLLAKGGAQLGGGWPVFSALHIGLVGGFGTLALTMMMRAGLQRERQPVRLARPLVGAVLIVSPAVLARLAATLAPASGLWLALSATLWEIAVIAVLVWSLRRVQSARAGRSSIGA